MNVYHKPAPACNYAQTASQCALTLTQNQSIAVQDIIAISIRVSDAALHYPGCNAKGPFERALQAKMSIVFSTAAVLANGRITEDNYHQLDNPDIKRLIDVTDLQSTAGYTSAFPAKQGTSLSITLRNGNTLHMEQDDVVPASTDMVHERLLRSVTQTSGAATANAVLSMLDQLDTLENLNSLTALCRTR
jgi:2-methylcitrate dehydratase PrpD